MAELGKLSPDERRKRRDALYEPVRAEHERLLGEARLAFQASEEVYGPGRAQLHEDPKGLLGAVVLHMPEPHIFDSVRSVLNSDKADRKTKQNAEERLVRECLVWPDLDTWNELLRKVPSWAGPLSLACWTMGKLEEVDTEGK
jgi:hypothetical protein